MAESIVQVNSGSGPKIHTFNRTIGANSVEDEVTLNGEPYLATYMLVANTVSIATANSHPLQIMAGASLKVRIRRIEIYQFATATTVTMTDWRVYRLTTAGTGGGAVGAVALDPADAAAGCSGMTLPTAKGTEGNFMIGATAETQQTVGLRVNQPYVVFDFDRPRSKPLIIAAGATNGIAIKNVSAVAAASVMINVWVDESNF